MNYWNSPLTIGNRSFGRFIGSPLDGVTNQPFRKAVRLFSPQVLLYTEICHCNTIVHREPATWGLEVGEPHINFQMSAADETFIERACERVLAHGVDMVDINIGCPAITVVSKGAGSALMGDMPRLKSIIKRFRACLPGVMTVKMRAGFKENNALDVAKMLEELGVDALCVHPRLQSQGFGGEPDYPLVGEIKRHVGIPVLVSGGIKSFTDARFVYEMTGVDGFLVGRALLGKPWLLAQLTTESQGGLWVMPPDRIRDTMIKHLDEAVVWFGPRRGLAYFKKHLKVYLEQLGVERELAITLLNTSCLEHFKQLLFANVCP
ncbi:MAG: tRNA-dihydrouridine synthase [bacterium]|nr:tRNA-dihydrouridine synthase [bacterium]